ncbi:MULTISPECIES: DNA adenine methylase [unclassified Yoonia]|uniref:DNA adenine methylase n=1 Tax=unclassified Yoonia TaxID=2629118 RepID=UPI002AFE67A7|nr:MULTISPECIES: DNA adenine methylase [unclassified Yoonia]
MTKVRAAAPVAAWLGGKKALHQKIIQFIDAIPHQTYVEPFVGMGGVFLRRTWQPRLEVANDRNGEITNLFRILQRHYPQFIDVMKYQIASRRDFERLRETDPSMLTDLERAARFLVLQRLAFGGQVNGVFGVAPSTAPRFSLAKLEPLLDAAHARLDGVVFENLDWCDVIARYDTDQTLFYLDPPYLGGENDYGKGLFDRDQFGRIAQSLRDMKGAAIVSINDRPEVRALFDGLEMHEVTLRYTVSSKGATEASELIIINREVRTGLL